MNGTLTPAKQLATSARLRYQRIIDTLDGDRIGMDCLAQATVHLREAERVQDEEIAYANTVAAIAWLDATEHASQAAKSRAIAAQAGARADQLGGIA